MTQGTTQSVGALSKLANDPTTVLRDWGVVTAQNLTATPPTVTVKVNGGGGSIKMRFPTSGPVPAIGTTVAIDNSSSDNMVGHTPSTGVGTALPPGVILDYAGTTAPLGWLLCNGAAVSRTTYANLYAAIGTAYGAGDGSTTFNLPNTAGKIKGGSGVSLAHTHTITGTDLGTETSSHLHGSVITGSSATGFESNSHTHTGTTDSGGSSSAVLVLVQIIST